MIDKRLGPPERPEGLREAVYHWMLLRRSGNPPCRGG